MGCPDDANFAAYFDGSLAHTAAAAFEQHIDECPACRELFAAMGRVVRPEDDTRAPRLRPRGSACGRYWVLDVRGAGGMGVVYTAYDPELDRKVALKLVRPQPTRSGVDLRARLLREARALARISHPNVVPVYDVGEADGEVFIAMELVPGPTLARWQTAAERTWRAILEMYLQAARGLARAHEAGIVHRDFKPSNAIVGADGRVRVVDFGLALAGAAELPAAAPASASSSLTATGALVGTPAYMAPEQWQGGTVDARSDQYSFCAALWEALTGARYDARDSDPDARCGASRRDAHDLAERGTSRSPGDHDVAASRHRVTAPPASDDPASLHDPRGERDPASRAAIDDPRDLASPAGPRRAASTASRSIPRWLRALLLRGLADDPAARFPDMPAILGACERRLRRGRWGAALAGAGVAAAIAALVVGGLGTTSSQLCAEDPTLLAGVWDEPAAAAVRDGFAASGLSYAPTIAASAIADLDAYAARWRAEHRAACEATRVYGHQPETVLADRTACLDDLRYALRARLTLLRSGDPDVVEAALAIVHDLPEPATCRDPAAGLGAEDEEVRTARAAVDRAAALAEAGRFDAAAGELADVVELARVRGWPAISAAALRIRGEVRRRSGAAASAEDPYYAALYAAEAARDDRAAARVWVGLTWLLADDLSRPVEATRAVGHARAALARVGDDPSLAAEVEVSAAIAERASGDFKAASTRLRAAVASLTEHASPADPRLLAAIRLYGRSLFDLGDFTGAVTQYRNALAVAEQRLGAEHPMVADLANNLGTALIDMGQPDAAEHELRRALAIADRVYGPLHLSTAAMRGNLANLAQARRDHADAERQYRDALQIYAHQPQTHPDAAKVAYNYGFLLMNLERWPEALAQFQFALDVQRRTLGEDHPDTGAYLTGIGGSLAGLGRHAEAVPPLEQAIELFKRRPRDIRYVASAQSELARALWNAGDRPRAVALAEEALAGFRTSSESERLVREVETWLADHHL